MRVLKLGFADMVDSIAEFFIDTLSHRYKIIRDDMTPEYLIFGDRNFGNNNIRFNQTTTTKIFYTGENQRFWDYQCEYAITFDHFDDVKHYRLPLYVIYEHDNNKRGVSSAKTRMRSVDDLREERKFCSFVVKNGVCEKRNSFFRKLNEYKPVSSGGPLFNNIGYVLPRGDNSVQSKFAFLDKHKFNLCFENASWPGYTTEKLYDALVCKTVPIYWGSPTIDVDFNGQAFLNWHDFLDDQKFMKAIQEVDADNDLYLYMYRQPMFTHTAQRYMNTNRFLDWFDANVWKGPSE